MNAGTGDPLMEIRESTPSREQSSSVLSCQEGLGDKSVWVNKSMLDAILKENRELKQLLQRRDEEIKKVKGSYRMAKAMFQKEWASAKVRWNMKRLELRELKRQEEELEKTLGELKEVMGQANQGLCQKEEQLQVMTRRIAELKEGPLPVANHLTVVKEVASGGMSSSGRKDAVLLFPEEVWKIILGNVSDPKDLWNLCNTCQLFEDLLRPWKTRWMLEQALPYLYRHIPKEKIGDCLLVSRGWYAGIHNFVENHPSLRPHDPNCDPRRLDFINPVMELRLHRENQFIFTHHRYSPFIQFDMDVPLPEWMKKGKLFLGRYACLTIREGGVPNDDMDDSDEELAEDEHSNSLTWTKVGKFLSCFGSNIMYLSLVFDDRDYEEAEEEQQRFIQLISGELFRLVPNLRKLRISGERVFGSWENVDIDPDSLPSVPLLEALELDNLEEDGHDPITHALLTRYHRQLRKLTLTAKALRWTLAQLDWPELQELYLSQVITEGDCRGLTELRMPKLTKLGINLYVFDSFIIHNLKIDKLLELIRTLSSTTSLTTIRLEKQQVGRLGGPEVVETIYAPINLTTVEFPLCYWMLNPSYDFLLRCFPLLENLHVFLRGTFAGIELQSEIGLCTPQETKEYLEGMAGQLQLDGDILDVNKYIFTGQMCKSNIWRLLPRLKVFSFQWDICTRENYEAYNEKTTSGAATASTSECET